MRTHCQKAQTFDSQAGLQKILSAFQEQARASVFEGESCLFPC